MGNDLLWHVFQQRVVNGHGADGGRKVIKLSVAVASHRRMNHGMKSSVQNGRMDHVDRIAA
jgi:hypothetical protein